MQFHDETLSAIKDLIDGVDGVYRIEIKRLTDHNPVGEEQACDTGHVETEWVDQHGPGMAGDEFNGTVTWKLGEYYLIAHYDT